MIWQSSISRDVPSENMAGKLGRPVWGPLEEVVVRNLP
jgi:hypothetical protein